MRGETVAQRGDVIRPKSQSRSLAELEIEPQAVESKPSALFAGRAATPESCCLLYKTYLTKMIEQTACVKHHPLDPSAGDCIPTPMLLILFRF